MRRPLSGQWHDYGTVGGEVYENNLREDDAPLDDQSVFDVGYDILYDISVIQNIYTRLREQYPEGEARRRYDEITETLQYEEAARIFDQITARLPFPALHTEEGGLLYSAWNPKLGRADFPPNTWYDAEHRQLWEPYAHPVPPDLQSTT